jgi:hypothetical protein
MAITIGSGITIGGGISVVEGGGGGGSPVTYTAGVEFSEGGALGWDGLGSRLTIQNPWINTAAFNTLLAQPSGTVYTATTSGGNGTITSTDVWTIIVPEYIIQPGTGTGVFGGDSVQLTSITFTPA